MKILLRCRFWLAGDFLGIGLLLLNLWVLVLVAKDCCENFIEMQVLACRGI